MGLQRVRHTEQLNNNNMVWAILKITKESKINGTGGDKEVTVVLLAQIQQSLVQFSHSVISKSF